MARLAAVDAAPKCLPARGAHEPAGGERAAGRRAGGGRPAVGALEAVEDVEEGHAAEDVEEHLDLGQDGRYEAAPTGFEERDGVSVEPEFGRHLHPGIKCTRTAFALPSDDIQRAFVRHPVFVGSFVQAIPNKNQAIVDYNQSETEPKVLYHTESSRDPRDER